LNLLGVRLLMLEKMGIADREVKNALGSRIYKQVATTLRSATSMWFVKKRRHSANSKMM
jgi:hypothetical protein